MTHDTRTALRTSFEAIRWNGDDLAEIEVFVDAPCARRGTDLLVPRVPGGAPELVVGPGGWVVRGADGLHVLADAGAVTDDVAEDADEERRSDASAHATEVVVEALAFDGGFD